MRVSINIDNQCEFSRVFVFKFFDKKMETSGKH